MTRSLFAAFLLLVGCSGSFAASAATAPLVPLSPQPSGTPWPTQEWPRGPLPRSFDRPSLAKLLDVVKRYDPDLQQTREVVVIWHGRLVAEAYAKGFGPNIRLVSWSMAKSINQALVGIAARKGLLNPDQPMPNSAYPATDPHGRVTWRQWLNMVDGMDFHEDGAKRIEDNDSADMLYGAGRFDIAAYAAKLPMAHPPGTFWNYNSAGMDLVANSLGQLVAPHETRPAVRRAAMTSFMNTELFRKIGMHSAHVEFDPAGTAVLASLVYATARDFAKFGYLYLRDGSWDGQRILPNGWVDFARRKTPADNSDTYGAGWWIVPADSSKKPYDSGIPPQAPRDMFYADGHDGQHIFVVPSKDLVVVRLGVTYSANGSAAIGRWVTSIINLFPDR